MKWWVFVICTITTNFLSVFSKTHEVEWSTEFFQRSKNEKVLLAVQEDTLKLKCPKRYHRGGFTLEIWPVNFQGFKSCSRSCEEYARVLECTNSGDLAPESIIHLVDGYSTGSIYYFIASYSYGAANTSQEGVPTTCHRDSMRLAVLVCSLSRTCDECSMPLGLEDMRIKDSQMTSSVNGVDSRHKPLYARLQTSNKCPSLLTSWCIEPAKEEFLQVDLGALHLLSAVATQGSPHSPRWVTQYYVTFSYDKENWFEYKVKDKLKVFTGNSDQMTVVRRWFQPRFHARYLRIHPRAWNQGICLRAELYGCAAERLEPTIAEHALFGQTKEVSLATKQDGPVLCGSQKCPPYAKCKVGSKAVGCSCAMECPEGVPVCADDGLIYGNLCKMRQSACELNKIIRPAESDKTCGGAAHAPEPPSALDFQLRLVAVLLMAVGSLGIITFVAIVWSWRDKSSKRPHVLNDVEGSPLLDEQTSTHGQTD
ncbi:lactadherin isoform X2 [Nematostella vectensis]|uniref:lactadherin isoform X2 n=1 Tax=Nematostella vectensis TaxID=45351 RepID=UPI0013902B3B|nr:lactadherin isoform X2 [Nematostella vectensis]